MSQERPREARAACTHDTSTAGTATCAHLAGPIEWGVKYYKWLTGRGLEAERLCVDCTRQRESGESLDIVSICQQCWASLEHDLGALQGTRGLPEIRIRSTSIDKRITETLLPWSHDEILDFTPVHAQSESWLFLRSGGIVGRIDADGRASDLRAIELPSAEPGHEPFQGHALTSRLHSSSHGDFATVVNDNGKIGMVYDLTTGAVTMRLDGGDYHPETVPFSFGFVEYRGRTVAVHRTAWNRLDASDAATGELLTARSPTHFGRAEPRPEHYLDYFHGRLIVSPDGRRIVDDGWVWHPVGIPAVWDVETWLGSNVWESEDGESKLHLGLRTYYWDHALCWLDADRIALGGIGDDEEQIVDGVRILSTKPADASERGSARELTAFAGPAGIFFSDGNRLFSVDDAGLSVWELGDGARIARIDGFRPTRQHLRGRELAELSGMLLRRWRY